MNANEAVAQRILQFCNERNISINKLAAISTITQSTLNNIVNNYTKDVKLLTILRICAGLGITVKQFFDCDLFDNVNLNI